MLLNSCLTSQGQKVCSDLPSSNTLSGFSDISVEEVQVFQKWVRVHCADLIAASPARRLKCSKKKKKKLENWRSLAIPWANYTDQRWNDFKHDGPVFSILISIILWKELVLAKGEISSTTADLDSYIKLQCSPETDDGTWCLVQSCLFTEVNFCFS